MSDVPTSAAIAPRSVPIPTIATISGRPVAAQRARLSVRRGPRSPSQSSDGRTADDEEEPEEEHREAEAGGCQQAVEVEVHPGDHEVDRDQEAEADALQPHSHRCGFRRAQGQPHDEAAGERAEDEVEADLDGEKDEPGENEARTGARRPGPSCARSAAGRGRRPAGARGAPPPPRPARQRRRRREATSRWRRRRRP